MTRAGTRKVEHANVLTVMRGLTFSLLNINYFLTRSAPGQCASADSRRRLWQLWKYITVTKLIILLRKVIEKKPLPTEWQLASSHLLRIFSFAHVCMCKYFLCKSELWIKRQIKGHHFDTTIVKLFHIIFIYDN